MRNDSKRLAELRRLLILDSSPERAFDDLTTLLASDLQVPITMINLLDEGRDWFKSCVGLAATESAAPTSFCEVFFTMNDNVIVVPDTTADERFADHPLVRGEPWVRFYAAARLAVNGQTLGTICAYDFKPRTLSAEQIDLLNTLAGAATELLAQRGGAR